MKKILIIIICFTLFSCEDVLVENPKSIAVETFYNTSDELDAAIAAIYGTMKGGGCMGGRYPAAQNASVDYAYGRGSYAEVSEFQGLGSTNINRVQGIWEAFYQSIRNANLVIKNAPEGNELTSDEIAESVGEAKFLRALIYFIMVRNWGGLPIRTEDNMDEIDISRGSVDNVYELIKEDLLFAEANLPDEAPVSGRASKWAAKTVLADVYFYLGKYTDARDKALEVINSNKYSLVEVSDADDFANIYGPEVITTSEEIFYLKYSRDADQGWNYVLYNHHPGSGLHPNGGYYIIYTDKEESSFIKNWDTEDLRYKYQWYDWDIGFGSSTMLNKKFADPDATSTYGAGNDYPLYRYADVLLLYAEADCQVSNAPTTDAMEKLNMIHRRAYGKNPLVSSEIDFQLLDYDKESFIELVLKERGYETMWEGKRWLDLKRTGEVTEIIKDATGKDVAEKHLLWPIPVSELEYNKAITADEQNPGY
ncbi:RagB/SusD family nutrient uptake outer membrane protein [Maribellus comscasis]|uniref:RagB/SusD family nutrient uptake outer membrane protein n=1 Tax=Maribellus comscasis TaxID=2681766 RepID=A0A6I6K6S2_9BACT|nr:RagB/SusD family nutrient uptake outer membrane protein [Maribellus comscasis]QGY45724.1 RagB/SusD family nutrient uptake outer membrane protein [Maribellus comscasis]